MKSTFYLLPSIFCLLLGAGCSSEKLTHGIPNLAQVEPGLYRGGQPTAEGWAWLKSQGVKWDIKLNTWDEAPEWKTFEEGTNLLSNIWCDSEPIPLSEQLFGVNGYTIDSALQTMIDHPGEGIYVHCQHGQDRTGLLVATYRVRVEHWPKEKAEAEMLAHGFHKSLFGLWHYWQTQVPNEYSPTGDGK